jgi:hypothetical protein
LNSTPSPRKASFTALKMAAGGGMAPPSPTPLMPYSVLGDGGLYVVDGNARDLGRARQHVLGES